ncbi:unnamed protein product [Auanema sp. JU1783]|nr:unnamed protein product [Auanema sp. JU1783]
MYSTIINIFIILVVVVTDDADASYSSYTTRPPCCRDHLGSTACARLSRSNTRNFAKRCNQDAEFRLIQCCSTCNKSRQAMAYDLIARSLVSEHCFDRYGSQFCHRYVNNTDVFEAQSTWSCDGENPQIAFRSCRKSCGFCNFKVVKYTLDEAQKSCKSESRSWKKQLAKKKEQKFIWDGKL